MPRGSAPLIPRGSAFRICFRKYTAPAVALMRDFSAPPGSLYYWGSNTNPKPLTFIQIG